MLVREYRKINGGNANSGCSFIYLEIPQGWPWPFASLQRFYFIYVYNMLFGFFTLPSLIFFKRADVTHDTRGHLCKLYHILVLTT